MNGVRQHDVRSSDKKFHGGLLLEQFVFYVDVMG